MNLREMNKDMLIKIIETIEKKHEKEIKERDKLLEIYRRIGCIKTIYCNEKSCDAGRITGSFSCSNDYLINAEKIGSCDCGLYFCDKHYTRIIDSYDNERLLCSTCYQKREHRIKEEERKREIESEMTLADFLGLGNESERHE